MFSPHIFTPSFLIAIICFTLSSNALDNTINNPADLSLKKDTTQMIIEQLGLIKLPLPERPAVEPHLSVNPSNRDHLVGAAIMASTDRPTPDNPEAWDPQCVVFNSFDGGNRWNSWMIPSPDTCVDPWTGISSDGKAYLAYLGGGEIRIHTSNDGGKTWSKEHTTLPKRGHDHETFVINENGDGSSSLIITTTLQGLDDQFGFHQRLFATRTTNGGKTFEQTGEWFPFNVNFTAMNLQKGIDGQLFLPYLDFAKPDGRRQIRLDKERFWLARSPADSLDFSGPHSLITESCWTGIGTGFPTILVDDSNGPNRGRIYATCPADGDGSAQVFSSDDDGMTWTEPTIIPHPSTTDKSNQPDGPYAYITQMEVDEDGNLLIIWVDQRGSDKGYQQLYASVSADGGVSFSSPESISGGTFPTKAEKNGFVNRRWPAGGDYIGLTHTQNNTFHVLWADSRTGIYRIRQARIHYNN